MIKRIVFGAIAACFASAFALAQSGGGIIPSGGGSSSGLTPLASNPQSGNYTTVLGDNGKSIDDTTGSSDATVTMVSAATAGAGALQFITKIDSGTGKVIVSDGSARAWLSAQNDVVAMRSTGSVWLVETGLTKIAPRQDFYNVAGSYTWTKPPLALSETILVIGGGSGAGSGSQSTGLVASGGAGGASGALNFIYNAVSSVYSSTEPVVIGAGGAGGLTQASANTNGLIGTAGAVSSFSSGTKVLTTVASTLGGGGGAGGGTAAASTVSTGRTSGQASAINAPGGNGTAGASSASVAVYAGGGGAGQAVVAGTFNGGIPGSSPSNMYGDVPGVGGIGSSKTNATTGTGVMWDTGLFLGASGAGGWSNADGTAGAGANGTGCGGAGGGGGASVNGSSSGAGGNGHDGCVQIITRFNFLLRRDIDPASNDNAPMWLDAAA